MSYGSLLLVPWSGVLRIPGPGGETLVDPLHAARLPRWRHHEIHHHACRGAGCGFRLELDGRSGSGIVTVPLAPGEILGLHEVVASGGEPLTGWRGLAAVRDRLDRQGGPCPPPSDTLEEPARAVVRDALLSAARPGGTEVGLDDAAARAGYSRFHFGRLFRTITGTTFHRYLLRLRHREALRRLAAGAEDLTDLALDLGFSSHSHFTTSFRGEYGLTPSDARDRLTAPGDEEGVDLRCGP